MSHLPAHNLDILLVGCGKMGGALLEGWLKSGICKSVTVLEPFPLHEKFRNNPIITHITDGATIPHNADVMLLATKPQVMDEVCAALQGKIAPDMLVLSIAAGKSIESFARYFGETHPIIRTMPNTPAAIGEGITVACPNKAASETHVSIAHALLLAGGAVEWIEDESLLDAVTALSGSGPAYLFHMIEVLERAGVDIGLPADLSARLARQTVIGSAALAKAESETAPEILRKNVTSPGGTTEAALKILMDGRLEDIYKEALSRARDRGRELNS